MIPEGEYTLSFVRSPGPGGQNVNKVASACELRFHVTATSLLDEAGKQRLRQLAGRRLTQHDEIVIEAHRHRGQEANRRDAIARPLPAQRTAPDDVSRPCPGGWSDDRGHGPGNDFVALVSPRLTAAYVAQCGARAQHWRARRGDLSWAA